MFVFEKLWNQFFLEQHAKRDIFIRPYDGRTHYLKALVQIAVYSGKARIGCGVHIHFSASVSLKYA